MSRPFKAPWTPFQDDMLRRLAHLPDGTLARILSSVGPERSIGAVEQHRVILGVAPADVAISAPALRAWTEERKANARVMYAATRARTVEWPRVKGDDWFVRQLLQAKLRLVRAMA